MTAVCYALARLDNFACGIAAVCVGMGAWYRRWAFTHPLAALRREWLLSETDEGGNRADA